MIGASVAPDIAHAAGKLLEITRFGEVAVDRSEADIGDRIELAQAFHHQLADPRGRDFGVAGGFGLALDARDELVDAFLLDAEVAD